MKRTSILTIISLLVVAVISPSAVHDHSPPPLPGETYGVADFRLYVPDDVTTIRGILFRVAPHLSDSRPEVTQPALQKLCQPEDFALMGARLDDVGMETGIGDAILRTLVFFATVSDHPELEFTTLYLEGYSWGGQFSYHFAVWRPQRVLGFVTMKGGYHRTDPAGAAILVPGYLFIGEFDAQYRIDNLTGIFEAHRPLGARWILAMQPNAGHEPITDRDLLDDYFRTVTRARLPEVIPPGVIPDLGVMPEPESWLGHRANQRIGRWECYDAPADSACWFPTRDIGKTWQALVSAGAVNDTVSCPTAAPIAARPTARLLAIRPNPFNPATVIAYELDEPGLVDLRLFDLRGRLVRILVAGQPRTAGRHETTWNGRDTSGRNLPSGTYICRLRTGNQVDSRQIALVR